MTGTKADIIAQLKRDILPLETFQKKGENAVVGTGLGVIKNAFPNNEFPFGTIHEFISASPEDAAATNGFVSGILSSLMQKKGTCIWISVTQTIFPPALKSFGVSPDKIIFIQLKKEKDILWTVEEALKCNGLMAVIAEVHDLSFTASRRLQLAVEKSNVTGFILRHNQKIVNTTACSTRWRITAIQSHLPGDMPGVGFPRWNVELLKVRNGFPDTWQIEFADGRFRHIPKMAAIVTKLKKKTG